jgi:hypothetical protein
MRTVRDALRSISRYMSEAFGDDWEVGFFAQEGAFSRPGIAVRTAGPLLSGGSRHTADLTQPIAVYVYPAEGESVEATFDNVMAAEERLWQAIQVGIGAGRPYRIPLYDFEGVAIDEGSLLRRYPDYLRVLDLSINRAQSPEDEKKWTVTGEMRVGWRRSAELPTGSRLAQKLRITQSLESEIDGS